MSIAVTCPHCQTTLKAPDQAAGRNVKCPKCGGVFVMPYATNLAWTHEVPHFARDRGRRVSVTLRAFGTRAARTRAR